MCGVKQWSTAKCKKDAKTPAGERESFPGGKTASLTMDVLSTTTGTRKMVAEQYTVEIKSAVIRGCIKKVRES